MPVPSGNLLVEARRAFVPRAGVVGVGWGAKVTRGKVVTRHALVVLVEKKLPRESLPAGAEIPAVFHGVPTDVREPVLMPPADEGGDPQARLADACLTDYDWIDWGKIHDLRRRQQKETPHEDDG